MTARAYRPPGVAFGTGHPDLHQRSVALRDAARTDGSARASTRKRSGDTTEKHFARTHEMYRRHGLAIIVKLHPPVVGAPGALQFSGSGHIDYMGVLSHASGHRGRLIAFDAKGCTGDSALKVPTVLPLTHKRHKASVRERKRLMDQGALLASLRDAGAFAAFLCVDRDREQCWIVTDVARIALGESVPFRVRDRDLFPSVPFSTPAQLAQGAPAIDYLSTWLAIP